MIIELLLTFFNQLIGLIPLILNGVFGSFEVLGTVGSAIDTVNTHLMHFNGIFPVKHILFLFYMVISIEVGFYVIRFIVSLFNFARGSGKIEIGAEPKENQDIKN